MKSSSSKEGVEWMTLKSWEGVKWTGERREVRMCPVARTAPRNKEGTEI